MRHLLKAPQVDRVIDLEKFAQWVHDKRSEHSLSLEVLARHISDAGYPISQNKLYRLEQNLKEQGKRPLKVIDYELKIRLEDVFGEKFDTSEDTDDQEVLRLSDIRAHLSKMDEALSKGHEDIPLPDDPSLKEMHINILKMFKNYRKNVKAN